MKARLRCTLAINLSAVSDAQYQHKEAIVLDFADHAVIPYAVSPEFSKARTLQRLTRAARIFQVGDSITKGFQDALGVLRIQVVKFVVGSTEDSIFLAMTFHDVF